MNLELNAKLDVVSITAGELYGQIAALNHNLQTISSSQQEPSMQTNEVFGIAR